MGVGPISEERFGRLEQAVARLDASNVEAARLIKRLIKVTAKISGDVERAQLLLVRLAEILEAPIDTYIGP